MTQLLTLNGLRDAGFEPATCRRGDRSRRAGRIEPVRQEQTARCWVRTSELVAAATAPRRAGRIEPVPQEQTARCWVRTSDLSPRRPLPESGSNRTCTTGANCAMLGSNQRLLACEASALPLS